MKLKNTCNTPIMAILTGTMLVMLAGLSFASRGRAETVLDRVVLEVNKKSFSQRSIEIYLVIKEMMAEASTDNWQKTNFSNWDTRLTDFVRHAIIDQEALRLNTFRITQRTLDTAEQKLAEKRLKCKDCEAYLTTLKVDKASIRDALSQFYRVKAFIRIRNQGTQSEDIALTGFDPVPTQAEWFKALERRTNYRTFDDVRTYKAIQPL